jgi:regulatory protein
MEEKIKKYCSKQEAQLKIEHYCSYQERCQMEVRDKLYGFGLNSTDVNELLEGLVRKGFLNEERFACAYAGGKFRQKRWGRNKIIRELKSRQISDYCIKKAMKEIDAADYRNSLIKTAEKYAATHQTGSDYARKQKLLKYLMGRGYEYEECQQILDVII